MSMTPAETLRTIFARRIDRRRLLGKGCELAVGTFAAARVWSSEAAPLGFRTIAPSTADAVIVPEGYAAQVVIRWGDPLFAGAAPFDATRVAAGALLEPAAARAQAMQFGDSCDGIGVLPLDAGRVVLCSNHEAPSPAQMFPGWSEAGRARALGAFVTANPQCVAYMQAAVGLSVVELERRRGVWAPRVGSVYNRRITAGTPIQIAGPARAHPLLNPSGADAPLALGTFGNCAAGTTPWGTYLTAEENVDDYFGNAAAASLEPAVANAHRRFGTRQRDSAFRWEYADPRFDLAKNPTESLKFGWIVELDPLDPQRPLKKRTALGRFKHEGATTVLAADGRAVVYSGDDQQFEYLYKFVTAGKFEPQDAAHNRDLLDEGTLHVARFRDDGRGEWLPLVWGEHRELTVERGFASQADVVLRCREAADRVGATPLDRPEDVAVHPQTRNVYFSCTQNLNREAGIRDVTGRPIDTGAHAASPRAPNPAGHIVEIAEDGADAAARGFRWDIFLLGGTPDAALAALPAGEPLPPDAAYFSGIVDAAGLSAFANPDNLGFDAAGNLWIVTDGVQPGQHNNGCFVCPTAGPDRGRVRQFMSGPVGAEVCGCEIAADGRTLFLTIQHPGAGGTAESPTSRWPDGGAAAPRASLIAIVPVNGDAKLGD
jgi:hypothetical protein